jgi:hypothetical protein
MDKEVIAAITLLHLSEGLCRGHGALFRGSLHVLARASLCSFQARLLRPTMDLIGRKANALASILCLNCENVPLIVNHVVADLSRQGYILFLFIGIVL